METYHFCLIASCAITKDTLSEVISRNAITVTDWTEEDRTMTIYTIVPNHNVKQVRLELSNIEGIEYYEY